jgi:hypothetical protein
MFARQPQATESATPPRKKGPKPRRTLNVPIELGERIADAADYHQRKVSSLVVELLMEGLDRMAEAESERLGQPGFEYPRRPSKS